MRTYNADKKNCILHTLAIYYSSRYLFLAGKNKATLELASENVIELVIQTCYKYMDCQLLQHGLAHLNWKSNSKCYKLETEKAEHFIKTFYNYFASTTLHYVFYYKKCTKIYRVLQCRDVRSKCMYHVNL